MFDGETRGIPRSPKILSATPRLPRAARADDGDDLRVGCQLLGTSGATFGEQPSSSLTRSLVPRDLAVDVVKGVVGPIVNCEFGSMLAVDAEALVFTGDDEQGADLDRLARRDGYTTKLGFAFLGVPPPPPPQAQPPG